MVNPCCDVTKTTVNEIKNLSKMSDISLLQAKLFQELKAMLHGAIFLATCNAILLLRDVN